MKIRDIKNNLKNEHDEKSVPDVFSRAKKAPINRLLTGEEPLRAFDKATAVRLLWIALALLLVCALAFSALALMQDNKPAPSQSYVRLSVESEGKTIVYGFVISDESVIVCTLERDGEDTPFSNVGKQGENIKYAIISRFFQVLLQIFSSIRFFTIHNIFGSTSCNNLTSINSTFWTEINNIIRNLYQIKIMFNH